MRDTDSDAAAAPGMGSVRSGIATFSLVLAIAWRNLGRNRRRTWLVAGAIAFSVFLTVFFMSMQTGSYSVMTENATGFLTGHIQIQAQGYSEDPRIDATLSEAQARTALVLNNRRVVEVAPRALSYVLASAGERSVGAQLVGVVPEAELVLSSLPGFLERGAYLAPESTPRSSDGDIGFREEAYIGKLLAQNLGLGVGDELILLGSQKQGGIATLVVIVTGIFSSGQTEVDRGLIQIPLSTFQAAFELTNEVHMLVVKTRNVNETSQVAKELAVSMPLLHVQDWPLLLPELEQAISVDQMSGRLFYGMLLVMVIFSVVNTFIMMVFERTREFGVLLSLGMRPWPIVSLLQIEAFWLCMLGIAGGVIIAAIAVFILGDVGIPLGDNAEIMKTFHLPDRIYPAFSLDANLASPIIMLVCIQIAAFLSSIRVLKMNPVMAMRSR